VFRRLALFRGGGSACSIDASDNTLKALRAPAYRGGE